jgi:hypothetical protein
MDNLIDRD